MTEVSGVGNLQTLKLTSRATRYPLWCDLNHHVSLIMTKCTMPPCYVSLLRLRIVYQHVWAPRVDVEARFWVNLVRPFKFLDETIYSWNLEVLCFCGKNASEWWLDWISLHCCCIRCAADDLYNVTLLYTLGYQVGARSWYLSLNEDCYKFAALCILSVCIGLHTRN